MVWNNQNADCSLKNKFIVLFIITFGTPSFPMGALSSSNPVQLFNVFKTTDNFFLYSCTAVGIVSYNPVSPPVKCRNAFHSFRRHLKIHVSDQLSIAPPPSDKIQRLRFTYVTTTHHHHYQVRVAVASLHHHVHGRQDASRGLQSDGWNRFVAGRANCSVDDQVGDATCGQEVGWVIRWCGAEEPRLSCSVSSWSRATCPNTEMRRRDKRRGSEVRPVRWSTSSFRTNGALWMFYLPTYLCWLRQQQFTAN